MQDYQNNQEVSTDRQWRSFLEGQGATGIEWDANTGKTTATIDGQTYLYDTSGLKNINGRLYGSQEQLKGIFDKPLIQVRNGATSQGVNVGYDKNNNAPILNGQQVSTRGMENVGGNYYTTKDNLNSLVSGVKPEEYVDPYEDVNNQILKELINRKFSYDPRTDEDLKKAQEQEMALMRQQAYEMGRGNTSWMDYQTQKVAEGLASEYRDNAYSKYMNDQNYLLNLLGITGNLSAQNLNKHNVLESLKNQDREFAVNQEYNVNQLDFAERQLAETIRMNNHNMSADEQRILLDKATQEIQRQGLKTEDELNNYNRWLNAFLAIGEVTTDEMARVLGLPIGTRTIDYLNYGLSASKYGNTYTQPKDIGTDGNGNGPEVSLEELITQ